MVIVATWSDATLAVFGMAGVPSIFEHVGTPYEKPARGQFLRHLATETLDGGTVWIRYAVEREPAESPEQQPQGMRSISQSS
jgi:hypothetical protein